MNVKPRGTALMNQPYWQKSRIGFAVACLLVGLGQMAIAQQGGLFYDGQISVNGKSINWYGYWSTYHWWITYLAILPIALWFAVPCVFECVRTGFSRRNIVPLTAFVVLTLSWACYYLGKDTVRSLTESPERYCQWNRLTAPPPVPSDRSYQLILFWISTVNYAVSATIVVAASFGATCYLVTAVVRRTLSQVSGAHVDMLLRGQRMSSLALLAHLVVLRSSKASLYLKSSGINLQVTKPASFLEYASVYEETLGRGLIDSLVLGGIGIMLAFASHCLACVPQGQTGYNALVEGAKCGRTRLGPVWWLFTGWSLVFIVIPPPTLSYLVVICLLSTGAYFVKEHAAIAKP